MGEWLWELQWRRSWFQWEQSVVQQMLDTIGEFQPKQNKLDDWAWNLNVEKKYVLRKVGLRSCPKALFRRM